MSYDLLPKQREFLEVPHNQGLDVALYQGGFGSGKTFSGSLLGIMLCRKYPGCVGLVGAKEYSLLKDTTMVSYFEHLDNLGYIKDKHYKYNKTDKVILFKNGSKILFKDLADPEKLKSLNIHWAEVEEASQVPDATIKVILSRLRGTIKPDWKNFVYRFFMHTNPQASKGWIYKRFVEHKPKNYRRILAPTADNTHLPSHFIQSMKDDFDPEYYRINVLGQDGDYASGLVVKGFTDENVHKLTYDETLPLHLTCDFNVDPMMWCVAHKDEETVYFLDEIVIENTTTEQCINEFIRRYPNHKGEIIINGDASGDNRSTKSLYTDYTIITNALKKHGYNPKVKIRSFNPPIMRRVQAFNARVRNSNGDIRLYVDPKCKWLLHNIYNLKYKEGTSEIDIPTHHQVKKDRDSKFLSHIFDASSYLTEYYWTIRKE
jgi:PBSX family phage terminase large subunit|nr:MAG TPA: large terminase [Caudoviricetes sp.]